MPQAGHCCAEASSRPPASGCSGAQQAAPKRGARVGEEEREPGQADEEAELNYLTSVDSLPDKARRPPRAHCGSADSAQHSQQQDPLERQASVRLETHHKWARNYLIRALLFFKLLFLLGELRNYGWRRRRTKELEIRGLIGALAGLLCLDARLGCFRGALQVAGASQLDAQQPMVPQALVYEPMHEFGSGYGPTFPYPSRPVSAPAIVDEQSSASPALVTARCWSAGYSEADGSDCKSINVITNDQQQQQQAGEGAFDDSIITPVVVFESSSPVPTSSDGLEPDEASGERQSQQFEWSTQPASTYLAPPYETGSSPGLRSELELPSLSRHRTPPSAGLPQTPAPDSSDESARASEPAEDEAFFTATTVRAPETNVLAGEIFVATPKPASPAKSTAASRKCRDENDDDCDESEEDERDEKEDSRRKTGSERPKARPSQPETSSSFGSAELGSGSAPQDDNENDDDDGGGDDGDDDDDDASAADDSGDADDGSLASSDSSGLAPISTWAPSYIEVTSGAVQREPAAVRPGPPFEGSERPTEATASTTLGAELEVVVHSTLPSSFPLRPQAAGEPPTGSSSTTTAMPDDTYKSKPVFPSSTSAPTELVQQPSSSEDSGRDRSPDLELATFKSVPLAPVEFRPMAGGAKATGDNYSPQPASGGGTSPGERAPDKNRFDASSVQHPPAARFESAWREKPPRAQQLPSANQLSAPGSKAANSDAWLAANRKESSATRLRAQAFNGANAASAAPIRQQTDMLPALLLYSSLFILLVTAVVFIIMIIWRWNTARERALLLSKSGFLGPGAGLAGSASQASHLQQAAGGGLARPAGLLATYAPHRAAKVSAGLVAAADDEERLAEQAATDEASLSTGEQNNKPEMEARDWSSEQTGSSSTTTASSGSQRAGGGGVRYPAGARAQVSGQSSNSESPPNSDTVEAFAQQPPQQQQQRPYNGQLAAKPAGYPAAPQAVYLRESAEFGSAGAPNQLVRLAGPAPFEAAFNASRSVEALNQNPFAGAAAYPARGVHGAHPQSAAFVAQLQPAHPALAFGPQQQQQQQQQVAFANGAGREDQLLRARVAVNPLATLSRRQQQQLAFSKAPLPHDECASFVSASPSLARTSSSSSFAFNAPIINGISRPQAPEICAKPLVDLAGRVYNDYTNQVDGLAGRAMAAGQDALLAPARKERSEAWYV